MSKLIPEADELSKPFWDAIQQRRLTLQRCTSCNTLQYPPRSACQDCKSTNLEWQEVEGKGHVLACVSIEDSHMPVRAQDQPFPLALVTLDEDPLINFFSNLPGTKAREDHIGKAVTVIYEELPDGSLIHEWQLA